MGNNQKAERFTRNAISSVFTCLTKLTVFVWINQFLLRRVSVEEYSLLPLVTSLVVVVESIKVAFVGGMARYIVEAHARRDYDGITARVSSMLPVLTALCLCFAVLGSVVVWKIEILLKINAEFVTHARLILIMNVVTLCVGTLTTGFTIGPYVTQRFGLINLTDLGSELFRMILLLAMLFGAGASVLWVVFASTIATLANNAVLCGITRKLVPAIRFRASSLSMAEVRSQIGFGAWAALESFGKLLSNAVPVFLLNRFGTPLDLSCFHLGHLANRQIRTLINAAASPSQPALTEMSTCDGAESLKAVYFHGGRYHLWIALLPIAPLIVFNREIIDLYVGSKYHSAGTVMALIFTTYPFIFASAMFYRVAFACGRVRGYFLSSFIIHIASLSMVAYAVTMRDAGATEATLAVTLTESIGHVCLIWWLGIRFVVGKWKTFFLRTLIPGTLPFVASLIVCLTAKVTMNLDQWFELAVVGFIAVGIYVGFIWKCCMGQMDINMIESFSQKFMNKVIRRGLSGEEARSGKERA